MSRVVVRCLLVISILFANRTLSAEGLTDKTLVLSVQGMGTSLGFGAGVVAELYKNVSALRNNKTIITGNSGGAILAIYFACHGFTEESIGNISHIFLNPAPRLKNAIQNLRDKAENVAAKKQQMITGEIPGLPGSSLDPFIEAALGIKDISEIDKVKCPAKTPFYIAAGNYEVVHNISPNFHIKAGVRGILNGSVFTGKPLEIVGLDEKTFNPDTFEVSWREKTYKRHKELIAKSGLAKFQADHPHLKLGNDLRIGKSCTAFVSQDVFDLLKQMPPSERQCDLRLTTDGIGMATAIRASAGEPTYLEVTKEPQPENLLVEGEALGNLGNSVTRSYWGGFILPLQAQDLRRMLPSLRVLGTGWVIMPDFIANALAALVLVNSKIVSQITEYWSDTSITVDSEMSSMLTAHTLSSDEEFKRGAGQTAKCLKLDKQIHSMSAQERKLRRLNFCLPEKVMDPLLINPAPGALNVDGSEPELDQELEGRRGLGKLIDL